MKELILEVLISAMNIKSEEEHKSLLKKWNIKDAHSLVINQVTDNTELINQKETKNKICSYYEKGTSKSRNRALQEAKGDICIFADDDIRYNNDYIEKIMKAYEQNKDAEMIIFYVESKNREIFKRITSKKLSFFDIMKVRISGVSFKRSAIEKYQLKFNENFGPKGRFHKGEDTVFVADARKKAIKIINVNEKIGEVENDKSTWFTGINTKFFYDQGAIFYMLSPKLYKILIVQYVIRKRELYNNKWSGFQVYKIMERGAKYCAKIVLDRK